MTLNGSPEARSRRSLCASGGQTTEGFQVEGLGRKSDLRPRTIALAGGWRILEARKIGSHCTNPGKKCWWPEAGWWWALGWREDRADIDLGDGVDRTWMPGVVRGERSLEMPGHGGDHLGVWGGKQQTKHYSHQLVCPDSKGQVIPKTCWARPLT